MRVGLAHPEFRTMKKKKKKQNYYKTYYYIILIVTSNYIINISTECYQSHGTIYYYTNQRHVALRVQGATAPGRRNCLARVYRLTIENVFYH